MFRSFIDSLKRTRAAVGESERKRERERGSEIVIMKRCQLPFWWKWGVNYFMSILSQGACSRKNQHLLVENKICIFSLSVRSIVIVVCLFMTLLNHSLSSAEDWIFFCMLNSPSPPLSLSLFLASVFSFWFLVNKTQVHNAFMFIICLIIENECKREAKKKRKWAIKFMIHQTPKTD